MKSRLLGSFAISLCALVWGSRPALSAESPASRSSTATGDDRRIESVPFLSGKEGYAYYQTPALAISAKGTVLAFCGGRIHDHRDEGDIDIVLKRSADGGRTWGPLQVLADDGPNPCKCACPVVLPSGGILVVYCWNRSIASEAERTTREVHVIRSDDDGLTWSKRRDITGSVYRDGWRWYGTGPCHAIVKRSEPHKGRIIVPARHNAKGANMASHVIYSDDGGETWKLGGDVPRAKTTECTAVELSDGTLMLNSRNAMGNEHHRFISISRDGGATFYEAWIDKALIEPGNGCQGSLLYHSLNPLTGKGNILFSNPANGDFRSDGTLKLSDDDGQTWKQAFRYAKEPAPYFTGYSDIAVMADGDVAILYERGETDPDGGKGSRYDEIGFTRIEFAALLAPSASAQVPLPASADKEAGSKRAPEIIRDTWGTPHIFAASEAEGFFALGYAAAEDRILQMDLLRRRAAGRLAEVFGPDSIDTDRASRIAGYAAHALAAWKRLPARLREALKAYAAGVNAFLAAEPNTVARRFEPLGILPDPWTPVDCLIAARGILALGPPFGEGAIEEYRRFRDLVEREGEAEAARRSGMPIDDAGAIVPESEMMKDAATYARLKGIPRTPGFDLHGAGGEPRKMSHAWAVSGRRSTMGKPILESDPQLPLCSPPFFYEFHLAAGSIDARGLGVPGCPGLFIGWNRRIAWGASALGADSVVTFLDKLSPDRMGYLFKGATVPFERRLEHIEVKGGGPVIQEVLTSRHGTVFNSLARNLRAGEAYLSYDAQTADAGTSARAMLEVLAAGSWDEFRRAMEHYYYPGIHIVYADVEGHVGYQTVVCRPLTARSPRRALEGWTGMDEVLGRIPFDDLPRMLDPETGFVSHANNLPVGSWYPYDLGIGTGGTGDTTRSLRLRQLLAGDRKFSVEDFERLVHRDDVNAAVAALLPAARKVVEEDRLEDPGVRRLLASLEGWDLHAGSAGRFPAAQELENTLTPYRGSGLQEVYGAGGGGVSRLAREVGKQFAESGAAPENRAVRAYLVQWLRSAAERSGRDASGGRPPARVEAGRPAPGSDDARTIAIPYQRTIPHNLPPVDPSLDIVSPPLACLDQGTIWSQPGNLYTQIVDLAEIDRSRSMIAPGNSEDASSPFRRSGMDLWVRGETHPAPLSRGKVEAQAASRLELRVQAYSGPMGPRPRTVEAIDRAARFVPAIPEVKASEEPRPLPGKKPDDPALQAAFRYLLRNERTPAEIDAKMEEVKTLVAGKPALGSELREALKLGIHLMEESRAGRLKVIYGSPHCLARMRETLASLGAGGDDRAPDRKESKP